MPGRVYARMAMPTVGHATGAARGSRAQGGCTWARAVCAASCGCCGAAVRYGAPGCIRPCNEGFLGEYIEARAWGLAPGPRRKFTDDLSVTLSLTGSTRGWEHAWLLGRFRQQPPQVASQSLGSCCLTVVGLNMVDDDDDGTYV